MPGIAATISQLAKFRRPFAGGARDGGDSPALQEIAAFGANPGALRMLTHVPAGLRPGAPLLVVLHGCTQSAADYDTGAGWSMMADRHGFAVLLPEQARANNANLCFNWFQPGDTARNEGEAASIRQMIARMAADHRIDPARVFITGLSAGGAMTASMLAAYPEVFAGGAIIAGLPAGAATTVQGAFEAMFQGRIQTGREWGDIVRAASPHRDPWPRIQIWQGHADATVKPVNAAQLVAQWADVHGVPAVPMAIGTVDGATHHTWRNGAGTVVMEAFLVPGLAHGTPLDTQSGDLDHAAGAAGPHMLEAGISSTWHIARGFGLLTAPATQAVPRSTPQPAKILGLQIPALAKLPSGPSEVISKALRAAGLMPGR
ncbi:MAG: PHB depolymerase family esterase [Gemmatimonadaceae bacterium]|nr:PHB depolymerase family esterase [Acetobacteraceae bacterium]